MGLLTTGPWTFSGVLLVILGIYFVAYLIIKLYGAYKGVNYVKCTPLKWKDIEDGNIIAKFFDPENCEMDAEKTSEILDSLAI